jgi:hypothetical protein
MKRFTTYALLSAAAITAAVAAVIGLPLEDEVRSGALLGVALSGASGGLALMLKRRALEKKGLTAVLGALAVMFGVRGLLLALGLWFVVRGGGTELAFVAGFFSVFFIQQTLELSWVVAASKEVAAT